MRLIDADKTKIGISEKTKTSSEASRFIDIIDIQPTAFDLESVIEQVKEKGTKICCSVKCNDDCENCEHGILMKSIIEILELAANATNGKIGGRKC